MKATEALTQEHRTIERVIAALEAAANQLEGGAPVRPGLFTDAASFITGFADGYHHRKEEWVLFPSMFAHGAPPQGGPVNVMLAEHEMGRRYTQELVSAARRLEDGDRTAQAEVVQFSRGYANLLRQHILKEDHILFPFADQIIPETEHDRVHSAFQMVDQEEAGNGSYAKYGSLVDALEAEAGQM